MYIDEKFLKVTMLNGSKWKVPIHIIAEHRARFYSEMNSISFSDSLYNDTLPVFEDDYSEVEDWASNNMDWSDVEKYAIQIKDNNMSPEDLQYGWVNGNKEIIE